MSQLPIADNALLSDCTSAALVGREGSVDWLCSIFDELGDELLTSGCRRR